MVTNAREKNQGREINGGRQVAILNRREREGLTKAVTFEQRPEGSKKVEPRVTSIANP